MAGTGKIHNCYNTGNIKSDELAGGIIGWVYYTTKANLYNCCNIGKIEAGNTGGIIGTSVAGLPGVYEENMPIIINNYSVPSTLNGIGNFSSSEVKQIDKIDKNIIKILNDYILEEDADIDKSSWKSWKMIGDETIGFE